MMLCLESSADPTVLGLAELGMGAVLEERLLENRDLLPMEVERLLAAHGKTAQQLTCIAVGIGPGSFTGLRVSLAFAKGLARGLAIPIWPVSSFKVIAANLQMTWDSVAVILPARRGAVHFARFDGSNLEVRH